MGTLLPRLLQKEEYKMRYIKQKHVVTTVIDTNLSKMEEITELLKKIKTESSEFILILKKNSEFLGSTAIHTYSKVKISSINKNNTVDFMIFTKSSATYLRNVKIEEIDTIQTVYDAGVSKAGTINTLKKDIVEILHSDENSRFGMMDFDSSNSGD